MYKALLARFTSDKRNNQATHISLGVSNKYPERIGAKVSSYAKYKGLHVLGAMILDAGSAHGCNGGARDKCAEGLARMCLLELDSKLVIENPEGYDGQLRLPPADEAVAWYKNWVTTLVLIIDFGPKIGDWQQLKARAKSKCKTSPRILCRFGRLC